MSMRDLVPAPLRAAHTLFVSDSLFRNATYLMASTAVMSVLGFMFWVFVAHLYAPADIGTASALISITALISNLSLLGLNSGLIRFLASSKKQSQDINAAALTVAGVTLLAGAAYAFLATRFGGNVSLLDTTHDKLVFTILVVAVSLNSLTDAVFISNRRGEYHTIGYATFGLVKLLLPLLLVSSGAIGIFGAYILAMVASLVVSLYLMRRGCGYRLLTRPNWELLKRMRSYTFHNYLGVILAGLPSQLMPIFIIRNLGPASVAFFSMAWTMANLLYIIPSAVTQSLLAESSYNPRKQADHLKRTIRLLAFLLIPAVTISIVISPYLLNIFGPQYRQSGSQIFQILAFMTFFMAISSVCNTMLNIERRTWGIVAVQAATLVTTGFSVLFLIRFGLTGVGLSFLIGNIAATLTHVWLRLKRPRHSLIETDYPNAHVELREMLSPYGLRQFSETLLGNGSKNRTILIRTHHKQYVLRIYQPDLYTDARINQEIHFIDYLADQGFATPRVVPASTGNKLSHLTLRGKHWQYLLMEFVSGEHPKVYTTELLANMAQYQAQLHLSGIAYAKIAKDRRHMSLKIRPREQLLKLVTRNGFSHFDYDASNLLVDGDSINGVLDFEGMRYGPLVACAYFTLTRIYDSHQDPTMLTSYLGTYQRLRRLSVLEKIILSASLAARYKKLSLLKTLRS